MCVIEQSERDMIDDAIVCVCVCVEEMRIGKEEKYIVYSTIKKLTFSKLNYYYNLLIK
jgi:hypothetical protein